MRAVVTESFGSAPAVVRLEPPEPGPGEIRIRVRNSSLNGFDIAVAGGYLKGMVDHDFPVVLGRDVAGTVDQVGPGVTAFGPGDDVFGVVLTQPLRAGAFGEYVVVPEGHSIARIPAGLDHAAAGVLGLAGAAAIAGLDVLAPRTGELLLVAGATGGVGAFVLQLASARGTNVIATAAPGAEADHVLALGATHVVDRTGDVAAQVRALAPGGVDAALHLAGDPIALADLVAVGGRLASLLIVEPSMFGDRPISASAVAASPNPALLASLADDVATGRLRIPVQRSYSLDEVPQAFADFTAGTIGKLSIRVD